MVDFYNEYTFIIGVLTGWMCIPAWYMYIGLKEHFKSYPSDYVDVIGACLREFPKQEEMRRNNPGADRYFHLFFNEENEVELEIVKDKAKIEKASPNVFCIDSETMYVASPYRKKIDYSMYVKQ